MFITKYPILGPLKQYYVFLGKSSMTYWKSSTTRYRVATRRLRNAGLYQGSQTQNYTRAALRRKMSPRAAY